MTLQSEFKLRFAVEGMRIYQCNQCFCLVEHTARQDHRKAMHSRVTIINYPRGMTEKDREAFRREAENRLISDRESHAFDPGGRAHWDMPRCAVKECREMEDHPNHIKED